MTYASRLFIKDQTGATLEWADYYQSLVVKEYDNDIMLHIEYENDESTNTATITIPKDMFSQIVNHLVRMYGQA